jgi:hypothetical protein
MSIANLFSPNDYDLFCKSITTSGIAPINTNVIDTINIGDTLQIAPVKAGAVVIGHVGAVTTVNGQLNATPLRSQDIGAILISSPLKVGSNSVGLLLQPDSGDIVIDQTLSALNDIHIGSNNAKFLFIGSPASPTTFEGPLAFSVALGGGSIFVYAQMPTINGTGGGCIPATANFIRFDATRINNQTTINWKFTGVNTVCTANSVLTIAELIPADFRPAIGATADCPVVANILATPRTFPGVINIAATGVIQFLIQDGTHPAGGGSAIWTSGTDVCAVREGSVTFDNM